MDPNQQSNQIPQPETPPQQPAQPAPAPQYTPPPSQPVATPPVAPAPAPVQSPYASQFPQPNQAPTAPQTPTSYGATPQPAYDPNYLDSIAPPPASGKFLSGTFGKLFFVLIALFVLGVSLIIAFSGKDNTADLQQAAVRLDHLSLTAKTVQKNIKSSNLSTINKNFEIWLTGKTAEAEDLLAKGGVKKTQYNKQMVTSENDLAKKLDAKFEDARLSARLNRVYSSTMAAETEKLNNLLVQMSKKSASKQIRDYAKNASNDLKPIQESFEKYKDDGN